MTTKPHPASTNAWMDSIQKAGTRIDPFSTKNKPHLESIHIKTVELLASRGIIGHLDAQWILWWRSLPQEQRDALEQEGITRPQSDFDALDEKLSYKGDDSSDLLGSFQNQNEGDHSAIAAAMALIVSETFREKDTSLATPVRRFLGLLWHLRPARVSSLGGFRAMAEAAGCTPQAIHLHSKRWEKLMGKCSESRSDEHRDSLSIARKQEHDDPQELMPFMGVA